VSARLLLLAVALGLVVLTVALATLGYAFARRRRKGDADPLIDQFGHLSNTERCEFIFAIATLDDLSSLGLLERALDDPCEAVALAAAHALTTAGRTAPVERFLSEHPGGRAESITASLELLA
jgi:HEAT repeat protein